MTDTLHERGKALEDMFFAERDRKLINALRDAAAKEQAAVDIGNLTGVSDTSVLQTIAGLGVTAETLAAFSLVPLLHVAWSDKVLDASERDALIDMVARLDTLTDLSPLAGMLARRACARLL